MSKARLSLLLIAFLSLFACQLSSKAVTGHEITIVSVDTEPINAIVGVPVKTLTINFNLIAETGLDVNRLKVFVNNTLISVPSNFKITPSKNKPDTKASVIFETEDQPFDKTSNSIEIRYLLTQPSNVILASSFITKFASGSDSGGSGTDNGNTSNGTGAVPTPHIFYLDLDEVTNGTEGRVSSEIKQFKLTVTHDTQYLDKVTQSNFNANTNPLLSNLKITSTNTQNGATSKVTKNYDFSLNGASIDSTERPGFAITKYISNGKLLNSGQKLKFNIDLQGYFEKYGIFTNGAIMQDDKTITINPLIGTMSDIIINPSALSFSNTGTSKGISDYSSDLVNIQATLNINGDPSTVSTVEFFRLNKAKVKIKPKLSINSSKVLTIKPSIPSTATISSNGDDFTISIPVNLETSAKEKTLIKQGFNISSKTKTLKIPMIITTKTSDDLDLIFTDTLSDTVETNFAITTTNGSSL